jgi:HK97 family phage prohead protease
MLGFLKKNIDCKALDISTEGEKKSVKVAISQMESEDRDEDIISKTAFTKTLAEKGPEGANEIWHLLDHNASLKSALSKFSELYTEGDYLVGVSHYKDSFAWREVAWPMYESGDITQHSIGFSIVNSNSIKSNGKDIRLITEVALWEGSAVLWGANPNTPTLEVAKSLGIYQDDEEPQIKIERMIKALKSDKWDDEAKELFRIELQQLYQSLADLKKATLPEVKATTPEKEGADMDRIALYILSQSKI